MKVSIYKSDKLWHVNINQSGKSFESEESAIEFLRSLIRETESAVDSALETYFSMKCG